ncbi:peptidase [Alteromonadales bacterium alter-6D02]|nr:peptidase [Alteromonadales bacterium alter-6D02]
MTMIQGTYYYPASSKAEQAELLVKEGVAQLFLVEKQLDYSASSLKISSSIPGVAQEVVFEDGGKFVAADSKARIHAKPSMLERLESHKPLIAFSIVGVPLLLWFCFAVVMPRMAAASVVLVPDAVSETMGEQAFDIIEELMLKPSELAQERQQQVKQQWQSALTSLNLSPEKFVLHVYRSDYFGANAFALPNGTVVITDDLLNRLEDNPDAVLAILLHEIGHVQQQHSLRLIAQSVSNAIVLAMIFGDIDGIGEIIIGSGSTLVQNAFSRDMEREADNYALEQLVALGKPTTAFADAMSSFSELKKQSNADVLQYLSTHPEIQERIDNALKFNKE